MKPTSENSRADWIVLVDGPVWAFGGGYVNCSSGRPYGAFVQEAFQLVGDVEVGARVISNVLDADDPKRVLHNEMLPIASALGVDFRALCHDEMRVVSDRIDEFVNISRPNGEQPYSLLLFDARGMLQVVICEDMDLHVCVKNPTLRRNVLQAARRYGLRTMAGAVEECSFVTPKAAAASIRSCPTSDKVDQSVDCSQPIPYEEG